MTNQRFPKPFFITNQEIVVLLTQLHVLINVPYLNKHSVYRKIKLTSKLEKYEHNSMLFNFCMPSCSIWNKIFFRDHVDIVDKNVVFP